jgi:hypothetical protein
MIRTLCGHGADARIQDNEGRMPLQLAEELYEESPKCGEGHRKEMEEVRSSTLTILRLSSG